MEHWLGVTLPQLVAAGNMAPSTLDSYRSNAELHILPDLGRITLRNLTAPRIRQWQHDLSRKPSARTPRRLRRGETEVPDAERLSARTVAYCRAILHKALADAIADQVWGMRTNPVDIVRPPKQKSQEATPPSLDEAAALMAAASQDKWSCLWLVILALGLRRGEALGLRWADVDFDKSTIRVRAMIQRQRGDVDEETGRRAGRLVSKDLKTEGSAKTLPVPASAMAELKEWRKAQHAMRVQAPVWLAEDLVFTTSLGTAIEPRNVNRQWALVCREAGTRPFRVHDLRHAWATYLLDRSVNLKTIQAGLRHTQLATTQRYVHTFEELSREAADVMDTVLVDLRQAAASKARRRSS